jgi:hypothetical protein
VAVLLLWRGGDWLLARVIFENPAFAIEVIDVKTDGNISSGQIRKWIGVKKGDNLLALDLGRIKRDLELLPLVEAVMVERILPDTLKVRVREREPIAQVKALRPRPQGDGYQQTVYYLGPAGYVMIPLESWSGEDAKGPDTGKMPVLFGINSRDLRPGRRVESPQVRAALELISAYQRSPMVGRTEIVRIDVSGTRVLQVTTGRGGQITFGLNRLNWQMKRWRILHDYGRRNGKAIATLDLSITNNVPARWVERTNFPAQPSASDPMVTL